jgi:hypothetical protein
MLLVNLRIYLDLTCEIAHEGNLPFLITNELPGLISLLVGFSYFYRDDKNGLIVVKLKFSRVMIFKL